MLDLGKAVMAGEEKEIKVTFPEEYHSEDLKGAKAIFKIKVHEVKTKEVPTLNDEFVKELELEGVNTVAEYQEYVKNLWVIAKRRGYT